MNRRSFLSRLAASAAALFVLPGRRGRASAAGTFDTYDCAQVGPTTWAGTFPSPTKATVVVSWNGIEIHGEAVRVTFANGRVATVEDVRFEFVAPRAAPTGLPVPPPEITACA